MKLHKYKLFLSRSADIYNSLISIMINSLKPYNECKQMAKLTIKNYTKSK